VILRLTRRHLTYLENEARKTSPIEACALLFGKLTQKEATVERIVVTPNVAESTIRFEIDSKVFYNAFTEASQDGLMFLGFFHSHPAPVAPSIADLHFMRLWGDAIWLIFSLTENRFAAFKMRRSRAYTLRLKIEGKD